jgi:hypothetical protein
MAVTADISSSFVLRATQGAAAAETVTITNPGRAFTVQSLSVKWTAVEATISSSTIQVSKVASGGAVTNFFTAPIKANRASLASYEADASPNNVLTLSPEANNVFTSTDNVQIAVAGGASQCEVVLYCIGNPSQTLTVT